MSLERAKWDRKFSQKEAVLGLPDKFLVKNLHLLKTGKLADIACGDGRNAIFLAKNGFEVTGFDFSDFGLMRLRNFEKVESVKIKTVSCNLEDYGFANFQNYFDTVLVSHFLLRGDFFERISGILKPDGTLVYTTFNLKQHENFGFNKDFCLQENELLAVFKGFDLIKFEKEEGENFLDSCVFRKG